MRDLTVVVTGANRGLGLELARQALAQGATVVGGCRRPAGATELAALGARVEPLDVADPASVAAFAASLGDDGVDVLFNNAGVGGSLRSGIASLDFADLEATWQTNALGPLRLSQALLPNLSRRRTRQIVNLSSRMGSLGDNQQGGAYAYRASKAALNMLTRNLALELAGKGFVVIALSPGWVKTDMGGANAPLAVETSVAGILRLVARLGPADNGRFLDHAGQELPW